MYYIIYSLINYAIKNALANINSGNILAILAVMVTVAVGGAMPKGLTKCAVKFVQQGSGSAGWM